MSDLHKKYSAIVLGTSAGGLSALSVLLADIPARYTVPIIVAQHRSKDSRELFEEVLQSFLIIFCFSFGSLASTR